MTHPDWFAALTVGFLAGIASVVALIGDKLDRIIRLLERDRD